MDAPGADSVSVFARNHDDIETAVAYHVEDGVITAAPWPFSVDLYEGYIIAYRLEGYPEKLDPFILKYTLKK
jgi:hypothetical protein